MCSYDYDDQTGYRECIECSDCREANDRLFSLEQSLKQVVKMLYSKEKLDIRLLDEAICDMCDVVGYESPETSPRVRRHESEIFEFAMSMNQ